MIANGSLDLYDFATGGTSSRYYVTECIASNTGDGAILLIDDPSDPRYWLLPVPVRDLAPCAVRRPPRPPRRDPIRPPAMTWHRRLQRPREQRGS